MKEEEEETIERMRLSKSHVIGYCMICSQIDVILPIFFLPPAMRDDSKHHPSFPSQIVIVHTTSFIIFTHTHTHTHTNGEGEVKDIE